MRILKLAAILIFISNNLLALSGGQPNSYFFYYQGKKIFMNESESCLVIKLKPNIKYPKVNGQVRELLSGKMQSASNFSPKSSSSETEIIQLNKDVTHDAIASVKASLLSLPDVECVGMCLPGLRKVIQYTTDEIIVKFSKFASDFDIQNMNRMFGTEVIQKVNGFDNLYLLKISSRGEAGLDNVFDISNKYVLMSKLVEFAQPNFIRQGMLLGDFKELHLDYIPNDSMLPQMWHVKNTGNNIPENVQGVPGCDMNLEPAWDQTTGNSNVMISVIDTGVDTNHVDLRGNLCDRSLWYDFYDNNQRPYDQYYHGTGVSGCCSAIGNNISGTVGVAFKCKLMPVRVFGPYPQAYTTDLILGNGINWAWTHGASILSLSWGGGVPTPMISLTIQNAVHYGRSGRGALVFAGSGNDNIDTILYPANMPEVMGIGGLSPCNERKNPHSCDFTTDSNEYWGASYGYGLSCVAPCTFIGTTELLGYWCICGNGTSCSAPLAAGVGALVMSKNVNLSGDSVRNIIERSCQKVGNYNYNVSMTNGMWNFEMGYGRIDAKAALDLTPPGPNFIPNQVPPIITISPHQSGVLSNPVTFTANISDSQGVSGGANSPRMYYYTNQNNSLNFVYGASLGNHVYQFTFPMIPYSVGDYYYLAAQDDNGNTITYPVGGYGANPPGINRPPKFMFIRNAPTADSFFTVTDVPKTLPPDSLLIVYSMFNNQMNRQILDLDCWVNINHTYDDDISFSLISPAGTEIVLSAGRGGAGQNYTNTYFDDQASVDITDTSQHAPFSGHYRPVNKLWLFNGEFSGGTWKLKLVQNGADNGGTLLGWGMKFSYATIGDFVQFPANFGLVGNFPNPFNPQTRIMFNVPTSANIRIVVYDVVGRQVATLLDGMRPPQLDDYVDFNADNVPGHGGSGISSGVYFYALSVNNKFVEAKKMVVVK